MDSPRAVLLAFTTGAFSFAVALAWNNTFQAIFREYVDKESDWIANLVYALIVTGAGALIIPYLIRTTSS